MKKFRFILSLASCTVCVASYGQHSGSFTDTRDGNVYKTITIAGQKWLAQNLAYKAEDGCLAYNNDSSFVPACGYLYTWETAQKVCPVGWRLPDDSIWTAMIEYLGGEESAGIVLRSTEGWANGLNGSDEQGFSGLPCGFFDDKVVFKTNSSHGWWWTATSPADVSLNFEVQDTNTGEVTLIKRPTFEHPEDFAISRGMNSMFNNMLRYVMIKSYGYSVRCVKE